MMPPLWAARSSGDKRRYPLSIELLILIPALEKYFNPSLSLGSQNYRAQCVAKILEILKPDFLSEDEMQNLYDFALRVYQRLNTQSYKDRLQQHDYRTEKLNSNPRRKKEYLSVTEIRQMVDGWLASKIETIETDATLKIFREVPKWKVDLPQNKWLVHRVNQLYVQDSTSKQGIHLTPFIDVASRLIVGIMITRNAPSAPEMAAWVRDYFSENPTGTQFRMIHGDSSGSYVSYYFSEACAELGITHSVAIFKNHNHVAEATHGLIWDTIGDFTYIGCEDISFFDLPFEYQQAVVKYVINHINNMTNRTSHALPPGMSPQQVHDLKLKYFESYQTDPFIIGKPGSPEGKFIQSILNYAVSLDQLENKLKELSGNETLLLPEFNPVENITDIQINPDRNNLIDATTEIAPRKEIVENQLNYIKLLFETDAQDPESELSKELRELGQKLISNKKLSKWDVNTLVTLAGIQAQREIDKNVKALREDALRKDDKIDRLSKELKEIKDIQMEEVVRRQKKEAIRARRKATRKNALNPKIAIMPEDFMPIFDSVPGDEPWIVSRDRWAHFLLRFGGFRNGNLRFITRQMMRDFVNGKDIVVRAIKSKNADFITIPFVPAVKPFLKALAADLDVLDKRLEERPNVISKQAFPKESEFWSPAVLSRSHLNKRLNNHLHSMEIKLKKIRLTSHSYRRGVCQVVARTSGLEAASYVLNHANIATTQKYLKQGMSRKDLKDVYNRHFKVKNFSEIEEQNVDKLSEDDFRDRYQAEIGFRLNQESAYETRREKLDAVDPGPEGINPVSGVDWTSPTDTGED